MPCLRMLLPRFVESSAEELPRYRADYYNGDYPVIQPGVLPQYENERNGDVYIDEPHNG